METRTKHRRQAKSITSTIHHKVSLARIRMGRKLSEQLEWLVEFAYSDLDSLGERRLTELGWEFVVFGLPETENRPIRMKILRDQPNLDAMRRFKTEIKAGLDAFFYGDGWQIERPKILERIKLGDPPFRFAGIEKDILQQVLYSFDLCRDEIKRLRLCGNPRCQRPFVTRKKGRGWFCSPRCSAYVRVTFSRAKDRIEARRDYAKLTVLEIDSKLRAALRPRKKRTSSQ